MVDDSTGTELKFWVGGTRTPAHSDKWSAWLPGDRAGREATRAGDERCTCVKPVLLCISDVHSLSQLYLN